MVKIENIFGDKYKGVSSNAIYQDVHGKQVRRTRYKQTKPPSERQLQVRAKFTDAINWYKSLDGFTKKAVRDYYNNSGLAYIEGFPKTWYNYLKTIYITNPRCKLKNEITNEYTVYHLAIDTVEELDQYGFPIRSISGLTDFTQGKVTSKYDIIISPLAAAIKIITFAGQEKTCYISEGAGELRYFDIRYFDGRYFE